MGDGRSGTLLLGVYETEELSLNEAMRRSWRPDRKKPPGFKRQPSTVLGSVKAYYYTADSGTTNIDHVIGTWDEGLVELRVDRPTALPRARQREIVESIRMTYSPFS